MEQQLTNDSMPLASIVFDLIQHCPEQSYGTRMGYGWSTIMPQCERHAL